MLLRWSILDVWQNWQNWIKNLDDRWWAGMAKEFPIRVDQRLLRWYGHVEKMDDGGSKWREGSG